MAWNNISKYLEKFFTITPPGKFYQKEVVKALNEILPINLSENDIVYRFGIIYIKNNPATSGTLKNEIFLNKEKIIRLLSEKITPTRSRSSDQSVGENSQIKDIRF